MDRLTHDFSVKNLADFFRNRIPSFISKTEELEYVIKEKEFSELIKIGSVEFKNTDELMVFACKYNGMLSQRSSRKKQFEIAKKVLKEDFKDGAIFVFYDDAKKFRFSFIQKNYGEKGDKKYTSWKRFTYFVEPEQFNKTFKSRIGNCTFKDLESIREAFSVEKLTKEFYSDLFRWYQWALSEEVGITFPKNTEIIEDDRTRLEEQIIRLITRLLFVWFIKQKNLVPDIFFNTEQISRVLKDFKPDSTSEGSYYNAILQNLFFATLNKAIGERDFARLKSTRDIKTLYRYAEMFSISEKEILKLFRPIPFLNGGLFECLDKEDTEGNKYYLDGFSRNDKKSKGHFKHRAFIANCVFFDKEKGIIPLLERYNFTVEENAPNEIQVALDPELLGNVFENLLGAFNEETKETARKQSGSFYTPREIVSYMVDESLIAYLANAFPKLKTDMIRQLFEEEGLPNTFADNHSLCDDISNKLKEVKILDPACGSGAFPMGILNRMVELLEKLDSKNKETHYDLKLHLIEECIYGVDIQTIAAQISKLRFFISLTVEQDKDENKENYGITPLPNLETKFVAANALISIGYENRSLLDLNNTKLIEMKNQLWEIRKQHFYAKKATDKKKLRERDEKQREKIKNYIAENTAKPNQELIIQYNGELKKLEAERKNYEGENWVETTGRATQTDIFGNHAKKGKSLFSIDKNRRERERIDKSIKAVRAKIEQEYNKTERIGAEAEVEKLAKWNPYDQNESSLFFDMEWMFGIKDGFDIVIGNPPYISTKGVDAKTKKDLEKAYGFADDTYNHFFFKGIELMEENGVLSYITPKTFWTTQTKRNLRDLLLSKRICYIFDTANPFEAAMVDTCIISVINAVAKYNIIQFLDGSKDLLNPLKYEVKQEVYLNTQNCIIFKPTEENVKIFNLYGHKVKELYNQWWDKISTSKNIEKNKKELEAYRKNLKPGDIALLGCLTEGGQGLATANNGKYIAVRKSTKWARNILESRPKKLAEAIRENNIKIIKIERYDNTTDYLNSLSETQIAELFDRLKEQYGRDIFGQGYIYRLIDDSEIADVNTLTDDEKENGIDKNKKYYVPYDKGDKDGNRWYLETPFAIAWSKENVPLYKPHH